MGDFNQAKYIQQFQKENYDRCIFNVPKGQKAIIEQHWRALGYKSLNAYVNDLINRDMGRAGDEISVNVQHNEGVVVNKGSVTINHNK